MAENVTTLPEFVECYAQENVTFDATVGGVGLTQSVYDSRIPALDESIGSGATGPNNVAGNTIKVRGPRVAVVQFETQPVRVGFTSATAPTALVGLPIAAGQTLVLKGKAQIKTFRAIRTTATSCVARVAYYR